MIYQHYKHQRRHKSKRSYQNVMGLTFIEKTDDWFFFRACGEQVFRRARGYAYWEKLREGGFEKMDHLTLENDFRKQFR